MRSHNPRQDAILRYLIEFKRTHGGDSPTHREIMEACGVTSTSMVSFYLRELQERGEILILDGRGRYQVTGGAWMYRR